tara:strand:+ start:3447 stop:3719 length:273 start_codon:yes stop_codon:yes gene_type:complete
MSINKAINGLSYALGHLVSGDHALSGRWSVEILNGGIVHRKQCSNHATAKAWALYILRRYPGLDISNVSIVQDDPVPGFPIDQAIAEGAT